MKVLFFDCGMGVAGDMLTSALLGRFEDPQEQVNKLNALQIPGISFQIESKKSQGIAGLHTSVTYHGESEGNTSSHSHISMEKIRSILNSLKVPELVRTDITAIYNDIAVAESKAHGRSVDEIHLHELGAMDAIADITAAVFLLHDLHPDLIISSPVCVGHGTVKTAHGILPVPAPATANLLEGIPCFAGDTAGEMCTPTGAALLRHYVHQFSPMPVMTIDHHSYGLGTKEFENRLNAVHAILGELHPDVIELSCNVDDMTPESVAYALDQLMQEGALDAGWVSVGMKKGRPGIRIDLLCRPEDRDRFVNLMFRHTTTIGLRETVCTREILSRSAGVAETAWGPIRYKLSEGHGVRRLKAEYDDLASIANRQNIPLDVVRQEFEKTSK